MKLLLVIFLFYINHVICNQGHAIKSFEKRLKPYGSGKILIRSGKYSYKNSTPSGINYNDFYTVFQIVSNSKLVQGVPESPYFRDDQNIEHKPRVKKVLPEYTWRRHKRSADDKKKETPDAKTDKPKAAVEEKSKTDELKDKDVEKEVTKEIVDKENVNKTETKQPKVDEKSDKKDNNKTALKIPKKEKNKARNRSKTNGTRSKTRLRKGPARNSTTVKKHKQRQGRSKNKRNKKQSNLRQPKSEKRKTDKKAKKEVKTPGNSTDVNTKETRRLTAAREALIEEYPFVVSIQKDEEHWCSGALLNPRLVITTANCLWKSNRLSRMSVRVGSTYTDHGGQTAMIQEVMKHPRWGLRKNPDHDIALLLLDKNIKFSHTVHGIDLPNRAMMPAFLDAWILSWGSERRDGIFDVHENGLQVYHSNMMKLDACNNITKRFGVSVSVNFICFSQAGKTAPCTRDTGAPAVSDGVLWGLASWGIRKLCGTERFPAVFSYTGSHANVDFLANATAYLMSEERHYPFVDKPRTIRGRAWTTTTPTG